MKKPFSNKILLVIFFILLCVIVIELVIIQFGLSLKKKSNSSNKNNSNCLNLSKNEIINVQKNKNEWVGYLLFCRSLKIIQERNIPFYHLGYLISDIIPVKFRPYEKNIIHSTKGRVKSIDYNGTMIFNNGYQTPYVFRITLQDSENNKINFFYPPDQYKNVKIYKKIKSGATEVINLQEIHINDLVEIEEIYSLRAGYIFKQAEITKVENE